MNLQDWDTLKKQIGDLIQENIKKFKWNNYQFFYGKENEYSVLITMEQVKNGEDKRAIIKNVSISQTNGR